MTEKEYDAKIEALEPLTDKNNDICHSRKMGVKSNEY